MTQPTDDRKTAEKIAKDTACVAWLCEENRESFIEDTAIVIHAALTAAREEGRTVAENATVEKESA